MQFPVSFEPDVLTAIFNNNKLFACVEAHKYNPFNTSVCANLYEILRKFRETYKKMPTASELDAAVNNYLATTRDGSFRYPDYLVVIQQIFDNVPNSDFPLQEVIRQLQDSMITKVFEEYTTDQAIGGGMTIEQLKAYIDSVESIDVTALSDVESVSYTMDVSKRLAMYRQDDNIKTVPTPWAELNQHIRGGPGLGDECIVIGPTGRGKSTVLASITAGAIKKGIGVLYFNLETSVVDTCEMLDAHFLGKSRNDVRRNFDDIFQAVLANNLQSMVVNNAVGYEQKELLKIYSYPPNTISLSGIEDIIKKERDNIHNFRLVVLDWGDCIKPSRQYSERRHEYSDVFHGIKTLARKHKLVIWTATMGNKDSLSKKVVTLQDISESYAKAFMARLIITICQTPDEKNAKLEGGFPFPVFRFWVAKNSKGPGELEIPMKINYGTVDIEYNPDWNDKMKTLYGFNKQPNQRKAPPDPKTAADEFKSTYTDDGSQVTKEVLTGKAYKDNKQWKTQQRYFSMWGGGGGVHV